jgi:uncharacterized membrane protein YcaP (DUF421 family)
MDRFFAVDWAAVFTPDVPVLEIIVRGTLMYLTLFMMLRLVLKRESGKVGLPDVLLIVLIADAAQNGMASNYNSFTSGLILVSTLVFWGYALDWLGYRYPFFGRLVHPPALLLVKDGQLQRRNMRQELISLDELMSLLRQEGASELSDVAEARMEGNGGISVKLREGKAGK